MRLIVIIFLISLFCFACVKRQTKDPVPAITYEGFNSSKSNGIDQGQLVLGYEDGDGDIFREETTHLPNIIMKFYYLNSGTHQFTGYIDPITADTFNVTQTIIQPGDGFKGKSIKGEIYIPMNEFRPADSIKTFKYVIFAVDEAGNKSNVVTTPTLTAE